MYYISKTLVDAETRYLPLEKLVLALVHATRKLPHYFQAHTVYVLNEYPLQSLLKRSDFTGRIAKWGTRQGSFDIRYRPRSSVKGQVLADFVAEFSPKNEREMVCQVESRPWKVFVDHASSAMGAGARIVIITHEGIQLEYSFRLGFRASNSEVEYKALLIGLRAFLGMGVQDVEIYSDSWLVFSARLFKLLGAEMLVCLKAGQKLPFSEAETQLLYKSCVLDEGINAQDNYGPLEVHKKKVECAFEWYLLGSA